MNILKLLIISILLSTITFAQKTSFEPTDSFKIGELNGKENWFIPQEYASHFLITNEKASQGKQSLKLKSISLNSIPNGITFGPIWEFSSNLVKKIENIEISTDIYFTDNQQLESEFAFYIYGEEGKNGSAIGTLAIYGGQLFIVKDDSFVFQKPIEYDKFNNLKVLLDFENQTNYFYLNNELIYTEIFADSTIVTAYGFFTNGLNDIYIDNINSKTNIHSSISEVDNFTMTHYVKGGKLYIQSDVLIQEIQIFDSNGLEILTEDSPASKKKSIDLNDINSGIYSAKVHINGKINRFQFQKK